MDSGKRRPAPHGGSRRHLAQPRLVVFGDASIASILFAVGAPHSLKRQIGRDPFAPVYWRIPPVGLEPTFPFGHLVRSEGGVQLPARGRKESAQAIRVRAASLVACPLPGLCSPFRENIDRWRENHSHLSFGSVPTKTRTWNATFGGSRDIQFHHGDIMLNRCHSRLGVEPIMYHPE